MPNAYYDDVETIHTDSAIKIQERIEHLIEQARQKYPANQANKNANNNSIGT